MVINIIGMHIFHFTSQKRWERIQSEKVLKPLSDPFEFLTEQISDSIYEIVKSEYYLVGTDDPKAKKWERYGMKDKLIEWTTNEVILKVPILSDDCFVRDIFFVSDYYINSIVFSYKIINTYFM